MVTKFVPPKLKAYDVVLVGGAIYGSSVAWWLSQNPDFDGSILVVERDPTYEFCSTSHTNSCMRQQFSNEINVRISRFAAEFVKDFRGFLGGDERIPKLGIHNFGYMYLAASKEAAETLKQAQKIQSALGSGTRHMSAEDVLREYPFYNMQDIIAANHNTSDEGYFDGNTLFDWWKRKARENGVEYIANEVAALELNEFGTKVGSVRLSTGEEISCGIVVNTSGPRAAKTAAMAGIALPVEPRKRYTFIFSAETPLERDLPLTIDPSGVHVRTDNANYMAGCPPETDIAVEADDFVMDHDVWEEKVWPALAHRIPAFERIRLLQSWVGHYAYNTLDQNAVVGPHTVVSNFMFCNGFSGHGLQQSPAIGRGVAEMIAYGEYRTIDLSPFGFERIERGEPFVETAVI